MGFPLLLALLALQNGSGRVIRAVYLRMAVHTTGAEQQLPLPRAPAPVETVIDMTDTTAPNHLVALLTELRGASHQQGRVVGPMGAVADGALLGDRFVFPEERATFLRVARITVLIERQGIQGPGPVRSMRVVAIGAGQQALADRVCRCLVHIRSHLPVAAVTDIAFAVLAQYAVGLVNQMATAAHQIGRLVRTALPVHAAGILVAAQAARILFLGRYGGVLAVYDQSRKLLTLGRGMCLAESVAGLTAMLGKGGAHVVRLRMPGGQDLLEFVFVAFRADVGPHVVAARWFIWWFVGRRREQRQSEQQTDSGGTQYPMHRETPG